MTASMKPRNNIRSARMRYITPMRLWSTLVIHSRQRYGTCPLATTQARTARMANSTTEAAIKGIGWCHGMASQVSLPSMSVLAARWRLGAAVSGRRQGPVIRAGRGWNLLADHGLEQPALQVAEYQRTHVRTGP